MASKIVVSIPSALAHKRTSLSILATAMLLVCSVAAAQAQDSKSYILAARRSGAIEIIDPESLTTISRIHFPIPPKSAGLNGVHAGADGATLYVEGPTPNPPNSCCVLYSIDLATLETTQVAGIPGTASRNAFVTSDGFIYRAGTSTADVPPGEGSLFGVRTFRGPAIDIYDLGEGRVVRSLVPRGLQGDWWAAGAQLDDRFILYAANDEAPVARLWAVWPDTTELGSGIAVEPFGVVPNCRGPIIREMTAAAGTAFIYEVFGWKGDRRRECSGVPGGAWALDPATGSLLGHVAQDFHFSELFADRERGELYGISVGDPDWNDGIELVRMDGQDGSILQSRVLERDVWNIAFARLRDVPAADVRALFLRGRR